ncbi:MULTISPECIES: glycosyltransferase [unclassified Pseudomonas]|uniref:glycosyltransferase n=1 Tax=unclassified Pseudomonas TaxID=196821 RepID=UPI0024488D9F|nr:MULTISPECIES: glycosyltransferase [unclassified Pseudomonas]MDH0896694.1 glycosyltransferase [Pseudomonas sp. GD03875]MDH1066480.1 glycosyltransferase [Pseudomonas sp. GD03985]
MNTHTERNYFSQQGLWKRAPVREQLAVADDVIAMIPKDVQSILDAGCGNGIITNLLMPRWRVTGCDISESALAHVQVPCLVADMRALPFKDRSFDLVLSSDVIEHLPDGIYTEALGEIARVSSRYVLIAVPYQELLESAQVNCPHCGKTYHAHLHQRNYRLDDVLALFAPAFTPVAVQLSGERWVYQDRDILEAGRRLSGLDYPFEDAMCPVCARRRGALALSESAQQLQRRFEALQAMLSAQGLRPVPSQSEILVLFERGAVAVSQLPHKQELRQQPPITSIQLSELPIYQDPINHPASAYLVGEALDHALLVLARRPRRVTLERGRIASLEIYDHVRGHYVTCASIDTAGFDVPPLPHGPHGCILRIYQPEDDPALLFDYPASNEADVVTECFADDPTVSAQLSSLLVLAETLESTRARLELALHEKDGLLTQQASMIESLNQLANDIEARRAELEGRLNTLSKINSEQAEYIRALQVRLQAPDTTELVAAKKAQAEQAELIERLSASQTEINRIANELEARRAQLESELVLRDEIAAKQATQIQTLTEQLESQNEACQHLAADLENTKAMAARLEATYEQQKAYLIAQNQELNEQQRLNQKLSLDLEENQTLVATLKQAQDQQEESLLNLQTDLSAQRNDYEQLMLHNSRLGKEHKLLQERYSGTELERTSLQQQVSSLVEEVGKVRQSAASSLNDAQQSLAEQKLLVESMQLLLGETTSETKKTSQRILVLSHMYPRDYHPAGGIFVHDQVKALRASGIDARVVSGEPFWINTTNPRMILRALKHYKAQRVQTWEEWDGVPLLRFPYVVSQLLPFQAHATTYSHGLIQQADWIAQDFPFDLIHAHTAYTDGNAGRHLAKKLGRPLVITEHTGPFSTLTRTPYLRRMTQKALNAADLVIAVSEKLLGDIRSQVNLRSDLEQQVVANLVDTDHFLPGESREDDGFIRMTWVGHFVPVKRVPVLLEAFALAVAQVPQLRLRLVGNGEQESLIRARIDELGLSQWVELPGLADRDQLVRHYRDSDFLVICSESETFGVVAIEAMSCGLPVLTTQCGGPKEIVSTPSLGLVVGMSVNELAEGIIIMARHSKELNPQLIRKVTELRFSSESIAQKISCIYSRILNRTPSRLS